MLQAPAPKVEAGRLSTLSHHPRTTPKEELGTGLFWEGGNLDGCLELIGGVGEECL